MKTTIIKFLCLNALLAGSASDYAYPVFAFSFVGLSAGPTNARHSSKERRLGARLATPDSSQRMNDNDK
jgi:hypothetical protein